ncbi:hypothetical protein GS496_06085 [Rhodococcus hoagii]|nr:hypothetical protein [Prescottella equi]MBM4601558.1 hypothetical protein [Prescottella equi]NKS40130.1 hypothetical protein [Prescottella equi]NKS40132.1 hypothetical protein [Prescottella equi]ORL39584.1 hypothetical protein A6F59_20030 [Prescottella equi]
MKRTLALLMVLAAAAIGSAACGSADAGEPTATTSPPASSAAAATTEPLVVTFRKPVVDSESFYKLFKGDQWSSVALLTYTTSICDALDARQAPETVIDGVLRQLQANEARPFLGWDLFDAQMLYAATTQYVCPEYLGKYVPN